MIKSSYFFSPEDILFFFSLHMFQASLGFDLNLVIDTAHHLSQSQCAEEHGFAVWPPVSRHFG